MSKNGVWMKIESDNIESIKEVENQIKQIVQMYGLTLSGPVPLPTQELKVVVRRTPCGDGSDTYETWRKRIHKRILTVTGDEKNLINILKIRIPTDIKINLKFTG
ncbi:MAG: 30S ribosomal protein S10 [bacterium]